MINKIDRIYDLIEKELITKEELIELSALADVSYMSNKFFKNCFSYKVHFNDDNNNPVSYIVRTESFVDLDENEDVETIRISCSKNKELIEHLLWRNCCKIGDIDEYSFIDVDVDIEHDYILCVWGVKHDHSSHDWGISEPLGDICISDLKNLI